MVQIESESIPGLSRIRQIVDQQLTNVKFNVEKNKDKFNDPADYYRERRRDYYFSSSLLLYVENPLLKQEDFTRLFVGAPYIPDEVILRFEESGSYMRRANSRFMGKKVKVRSKLFGIPITKTHQELFRLKEVLIFVPFGPDEKTAKLEMPYLSFGINFSTLSESVDYSTRTYHFWPEKDFFTGNSLTRKISADEVEGMNWILTRVLP